MKKRLARLWTILWYGAWLGFLRLLARPARYNGYVLRLAGSYPEAVPFSPLRRFRRAVTDFPSLLRRLELAAADPRIETLVVLISDNRMGLARTQEVGRRLWDIRQSGKKTVAVVESGSTKEYALAAQCERVVMVPPGMLFLTGLMFESVYVKDLLDHLAIEPDLLNEGKFKSAAETAMRSGPSKDAERMMRALIDDAHAEVVEMIARGRGVEAAKVQEWIDGGPFTAEEAREAGIVDEAAYWDEERAAMKFDSGKRRLIRADRHERLAGRIAHCRSMLRDEPVVAVLPAAGAITDRPARRGGVEISSRTFTRVVRALAKDDDVAAVVLRVASPGGSGLASDLIHRELVRLAKKKPLVVSMGDVAASGGYYMAAPAATIFAEGATLTGSIGVISGKVSFKGLYEKIGVNKVRYTSGRHADMLSDFGAFTPTQRARMKALNQAFYKRFKEKVGQGRKLDAKAVERAAQGRVFAGRSALPLKLTDKVGGLGEAVREAAALAKLGEGYRAEVVEYLHEPLFSWNPSFLARAEWRDWEGVREEFETITTAPTCLAVSRARLVDADEW